MLNHLATIRRNKSTFYALLLGICCTFCGVGLARFSYSAILPTQVLDGWFSELQSAYLGAAILSGYAIGAVFSGKISLRFDVLQTLLYAVVLIIIAFLLSAFNSVFAIHFILRFITGFGGGVLMAVAPPAMLTFIPQELKRWAGAVIFTGIGLGILASSLIAVVANKFSLTVAWLVLAVLATLPLLLTRKLAEVSGKHKQNEPTVLKADEPKSPFKINTIILLILLAYSLDAFGYIPHTVFWVDYLQRELSFSADFVAFQWGLFAFGAIISPFFIGFLGARIGYQTTLLLAFMCKAFAISLPLMSSHILVLSLSSILVGAMVPGVVASVAGRVSELVPAEMQVSIWGIATSTFAIVQGISAYVVGYLYVEGAGPHFVFFLGALALFIGGLVIALSTFLNARQRAACWH
ncbi:MAG: putative MFS family arabinose efflux permease [Arenicella sp.]|jgi:predicted MFS family arabinose efflux permease